MKFGGIECFCWLYLDIKLIKNYFFIENFRNFVNDSYV